VKPKVEYRDLYELVDDAILVYDSENRLVLDANERACEAYGVPGETFVGRSVMDLWVEVDREERHLHTVLSRGFYRGFETIHRQDGGATIGVCVNSSLIDFQGRRAVLSVSREVTDARRAEARLRETEAKYRTLVEQISAVVYIQEIDHRNAISYISPQIEAIMGYSPEEYLADPELWIRTIHPDDREKVLAEDARTDQTGEPFSMEFRKIRRDGRVIWVCDEAVLVKDAEGRPLHWQGILTDITERRSTEEVLRESEERFRTLVQYGSDIITILEADGTIRYESPAVERVLGYRPEEMIGTDAFDYVHPDDLERVLHTFLEGIATNRPTAMEELRFRHADGSWRYLEAVGVNLLDDPTVGGILVNSRDITERKRYQETLRRSEAGFAEAQRIAHLGSWEWDVRSGEARWSDEVFRIYGFEPNEFVPTLERLMEVVHPGDRELVGEKIDGALNRGEPYDFEHRIVRPSGEVRVVHRQAEVTCDEQNRPLRMVGMVHDITEPKRTEEALRESERRFRQLFENSSDALFVHDEKGRFVDCNAEACRALGYTREELLELSVADVATRLIPESERRRREGETLWERALRGEPGKIVGFDENDLVRKDGSTFPVEVGVGTIEYGGRRMIFAAARDITDRKRAEEALRESETRFRTLVEQIPAVTYIEELDVGEPEWNMVYVSPQVQELLGYSPEEYMSDRKIWEQLLHPDDRERVLAKDARTELTGEPLRVQYRILSPDGKITWIRDEALLVRDEEGKPLFWQGVMYDITDQKRAEEEVRRLNEGLERRVAERTAQLEASAERLRQSNRELQDFAYIASHDLQEPLRKVLTFGDRLKAKYGDALGEQGRDYLERMEGAAARMRDLIDDLLILSRVTTQARPFAPVDLTQVAREVVSDLEARIEEVGGRVEVGELPTIEADRLQMRQLLQNLIGNALKFHKSGVAPVVAVRAQIIEEQRGARSVGSAGNGLCSITVEDNGVGFDEEHLERIFLPFQRLHGHNVYEGTGMGLAICRKVVERHGGKITAESEPGRGATFTVTLPLVQRVRESWAGRDELGRHATPGR
jgi:PAS domain S-box-containing protein